MKFLDCNCSYGKTPFGAFRYADTPQELLEEMDFCGIDRALVHHAGQRFDSPAAHNSTVVREIEGISRLEPVWAILPSQTGELPEPPQLLESMKANGVRALWTFPAEHRYRLDGITFGDLFQVLIENRIPLFVKDNLVTIGDLLKEFPELTVVAANQGPHSLERYLRPILDTFPNLYVETSCYIIDWLIEELCDRSGPDRILFGTGFPDNCSGTALLRLAQAEISSEAKEAIAAGNLERLLEGVRL